MKGTPLDYQYAQVSLLGHRRSNQDRALVARQGGTVLLAVADGLGGHAGGELAAETLVQSLQHSFAQLEPPMPEAPRFLERALADAHFAVVRAGLAQRPPVTPLTTVAVALVSDGVAHWAHVGDSRLYTITQGEAELQTIDHTFAMELFQKGLIGEHDLAGHPARNRLSRCVGSAEAPPVFDHGGPWVLRPGDGLLLCSDGLWNGVEITDLERAATAPNLTTAMDQLAQQAERAGAPHADNVTAVVLRCTP